MVKGATHLRFERKMMGEKCGYTKRYVKLFGLFEIRWWWLEISVLDFYGSADQAAASKKHNHNVPEIMIVRKNWLTEIRYDPETEQKTRYTRRRGRFWGFYWVPRWTIHQVTCTCDHAQALYIVFGCLTMVSHENFEDFSTSSKQKTAASC
jgi:hypothetical protein